MDQNKTTTITTDALTAALAQAQTSTAAAPRTRQAKLSDEEKAARQAEKDANKARREAEKLARQAEKALKKPAHMAKVERAAEGLPTMSAEATAILNTLFDSHDASTISAFLANATHRLRALSTAASVDMKLEVGQTVRIVSGEPRFIGRLAEVVETRRIRCYVLPEGHDKRVYLLNSDVAPVAQGLSTVVDEASEPVASVG